jgi:hypothetical protein
MLNPAFHNDRGSPAKVSFIVLAIATLAACNPQTSAPASASNLWKQPESQLLYPAAEILDTRERDAQLTAEGERSASVGYLLGSNDRAALVEDFYDGELAARGWGPPTDNEASVRGIRTTAELMARSWREGDLVFRLGTVDKSHPAAEGPADGFATVFRIDLILAPAKASGRVDQRRAEAARRPIRVPTAAR